MAGVDVDSYVRRADELVNGVAQDPEPDSPCAWRQAARLCEELGEHVGLEDHRGTACPDSGDNLTDPFRIGSRVGPPRASGGTAAVVRERVQHEQRDRTASCGLPCYYSDGCSDVA